MGGRVTWTTGAHLACRLPALLAEWRRLSDEGGIDDRLSRLLERLRPLLPPRTSPLADADRLATLLPGLSAAIAQWSNVGNFINPWTVSGTGRREIRNAAILAALWSPAQIGDIASVFLAEFFARCRVPPGQELPGRAELARGYRMRVENCPVADGSDRVDLVVVSPRHLIGIEIKIDAGEGPDQLKRYVEAIGRSAEQLDKAARVILLAPFAPSRQDVAAADWSTVRAAAAAALPRRLSEHGFQHRLIANFARHIRSF